MSPRVQNGITLALSVCAAVVAVSLLRGSPPGAPQTASIIPNWERLLNGGHAYGSQEAGIQVVAFSDYQCPACERAHDAVVALQETFPGELTVVYRHLPLTGIHPHARDAAIAAECAAAQAGFDRFHEALFRHQDSLGVIPWERLAERSGIGDVPGFATCLRSEPPRRRVAQDLALASVLGLNSVPRYVVDGRLLSGDEALRQLRRLLVERH